MISLKELPNASKKSRTTALEWIWLTGYFALDIIVIWHESHPLAIFSAAIVVITFVVFTYWNLPSIGLSVLVAVIAFIVYCKYPTPIDTYRGWLQPANEEAPSNLCDKVPSISHDGGITALIGSQVAFHASPQFLKLTSGTFYPCI